MMYKMSIQQAGGKKPLMPQFIQKEEEEKEDKTLVTETKVEVMISKDKISDELRMDAEMSNRRGNYRQNFGRSNSRDRGSQNFRRNSNNDRSRSRGRSPTPTRYIT